MAVVGRCIVCGTEEQIHEFTRSRDEETGSLVSGTAHLVHVRADGTVATACQHHEPDEVRTAFVLAALTLREASLDEVTR